MYASLALSLPVPVLSNQNGTSGMLPAFFQVPPPATLYAAMKAWGSRTLETAQQKIDIPERKRQLCQTIWFLLNNTLLLQMGTTYKRRFEEFENISDDMLLVDQWRKDQQDEWNRLSTTLALLATMNTTILAISPQAPSLAFATWLGGAGLSVCGVFVVQYFSIKAFSVTDEDVGLVLNEDGGYASLAVLAGIIAGPVVMKLWSAVLFLIGTIDGTAIVLLAMVVGERIDRKSIVKSSQFT